ncbi:MAG: hypothetical protein HQK78_14430 [Desulfobacterales bacterium]|nr:hypothetical protein [Desulfobacterales bacterium]
MKIDFAKLSQAEISRALGLTTKTIARWVSDGCPRDANGKYSLADVFAWRIAKAEISAQDEGEKSQKDKWLTKLRKEQALIAEIERKKLEKQYVDIDEVNSYLFSAARQIRDNIQAIPERISALVAVEQDAWKCKRLMAEEIDFVLHDLSNKLSVEAT